MKNTTVIVVVINIAINLLRIAIKIIVYAKNKNLQKPMRLRKTQQRGVFMQNSVFALWYDNIMWYFDEKKRKLSNNFKYIYRRTFHVAVCTEKLARYLQIQCTCTLICKMHFYAKAYIKIGIIYLFQFLPIDQFHKEVHVHIYM